MEKKNHISIIVLELNRNSILVSKVFDLTDSSSMNKRVAAPLSPLSSPSLCKFTSLRVAAPDYLEYLVLPDSSPSQQWSSFFSWDDQDVAVKRGSIDFNVKAPFDMCFHVRHVFELYTVFDIYYMILLIVKFITFSKWVEPLSMIESIYFYYIDVVWLLPVPTFLSQTEATSTIF